VSLAAFIADQRTSHRVPHAVSCRALDVSESWFYKWHERPPTAREERRVLLDVAVAMSFEASGGSYGSPRVYDDLVEEGWQVSVNTVAESMARQGLVARPKKRRKNLTRPDKKKRPFPGSPAVFVGGFHARPGRSGQHPPRVRKAIAMSASGLWNP
jgi:hypothetical protein